MLHLLAEFRWRYVKLLLSEYILALYELNQRYFAKTCQVISFINKSQNFRTYEEKFSSLEEEGPNALEVAT
jgi:hypothetical protein